MTVNVKDFGMDNMPMAVLEEYGAKTKDPRLKEIMLALITHLHEFVKEVQLTEEEWFQAIMYLTAVGQKCDDKRQEFILLSDTLGVSALVDSINNMREGIGTENTVLGPFYETGAPEYPMGANIVQKSTEEGVTAVVRGKVLDKSGAPVSGGSA